ncbi:MAG: glycosyltransferase [Myxococcales bacterium]|nr:glycosyltransferase [Myxococcales bacterium]
MQAQAEAPVVRAADGCSAAWVAACGKSRLRWARHVAAERAVLRAAGRVIAISPRVAADLAEHYGLEAEVLLNPVFAAAAPAAARDRDLLFAGHGFDRKGLGAALAVVARLPGAHLTVVGRDGRPDRWRRRAARLGVAERVDFVGPAPLWPWLARARLLLHPARYEPYGNVVAEAAAAGVPAVVSAATGAACLLHLDHVWAASEASTRWPPGSSRPRDAARPGAPPARRRRAPRRAGSPVGRGVKTLVIDTAFLGDLIFTLPLLENLGQAGHAVHLVARPRLATWPRARLGCSGCGPSTSAARTAAPRACGGWADGCAPSASTWCWARTRRRAAGCSRRRPARPPPGWGPVGYTRRVPRGPRFVETRWRWVRRPASRCRSDGRRCARRRRTRPRRPAPSRACPRALGDKR